MSSLPDFSVPDTLTAECDHVEVWDVPKTSLGSCGHGRFPSSRCGLRILVNAIAGLTGPIRLRIGLGLQLQPTNYCIRRGSYEYSTRMDRGWYCCALVRRGIRAVERPGNSASHWASGCCRQHTDHARWLHSA